MLLHHNGLAHVDLKKEVNNNARELNRNVEHTPDIVLLIIFNSPTSLSLSR